MDDSHDNPPPFNEPGWVSTLGAISWIMVIGGAVLWFLRNDVTGPGVPLFRLILSVVGFVGIMVVPAIRKRYQ